MKSKFAVQEFTNPFGETVYLVQGRLDGERIRKNFTSRKEADAEKQLLEIQVVQKETGVRVAATRLSIGPPFFAPSVDWRRTPWYRWTSRRPLAAWCSIAPAPKS